MNTYRPVQVFIHLWTALVSITNDLHIAKYYRRFPSLKVSTAFEPADHLLLKLFSSILFRDTSLGFWFFHYIVCYNFLAPSVGSLHLPIFYIGVTQDSFFSYFLFSIYFYFLSDLIWSHGLKCYLSKDDHPETSKFSATPPLIHCVFVVCRCLLESSGWLLVGISNTVSPKLKFFFLPQICSFLLLLA